LRELAIEGSARAVLVAAGMLELACVPLTVHRCLGMRAWV